MNKSNVFNLLLYVGLCLTTPLSGAAEWSIEPTLSFQTGYNNNITLTANEDKPASAEISFQPGATFSRQTEVSSLSGSVGAHFRRYPEETGLNDDNLKFNASASRNFQRANYRLNLGFTKDTTLESELEETGLVFGHTDRTKKSVSPGWVWRFSDRVNLNLNYTYNVVEFDDNKQGYVNHDSHSGRLSLNRILNERSTISLAISQTLNDNDNDVLSRSTNVQVGYDYALSQTLSASLFAGTRETTSKFSRQFFLANVIPFTQQVKTEETGAVFSASLSKTAERGQHSIDISRNVNSSVSGRVVEVTRIGVNNRYLFSKRLSTSLKIDLSRSQSIADVDTINNLQREYYTIVPRVSWKLSRDWTISGNYRFREQTNNFSDKNLIQRSFFINFNYRWPKIAISR